MRHLRLYEELGNGCPLDNDVDKEQIMDLCEPFMVPLMDDGEFSYEVLSREIDGYPFVCVTIYKQDEGDFTWGQVKDNVIPMFHMLCKRYMPDDWSVRTGQQVHLWTGQGNTTVYYVEDL